MVAPNCSAGQEPAAPCCGAAPLQYLAHLCCHTLGRKILFSSGMTLHLLVSSCLGDLLTFAMAIHQPQTPLQQSDLAD